MGKKSKRKGKKKAGGSAAAPSAATSAATSAAAAKSNAAALKMAPESIPIIADLPRGHETPPPGASCWICLDEEEDETGLPIERTCSCRGNSGFVHLSCCAKYAEEMAFGLLRQGRGPERNLAFFQQWMKCTNCKQQYQYDFSLELINKCVAFAKEHFPGSEATQLLAIYTKSCVLQELQCTERVQAESLTIANDIISMIRQDRERAMPTLPTWANFLEAQSYSTLGFLNDWEAGNLTKENSMIAIGYYEKSIEALKVWGGAGCGPNSAATVEASIADVENRIANARTNYAKKFGDEQTTIDWEAELERHRGTYRTLTDAGQSLAGLPTRGPIVFDLFNALLETNRGIEAQRFMTMMYAECRQLHGPDHRDTKRLERSLKRSQVRRVCTAYQGDVRIFEALRYTADGKRLVIRGPMEEDSFVSDGMKVFSIRSDNFTAFPGTPVVYDGKIGDMRSFDEGTKTYRVHFDDGKLGPRSVHWKSVRILFEIPEVE